MSHVTKALPESTHRPPTALAEARSLRQGVITPNDTGRIDAWPRTVPSRGPSCGLLVGAERLSVGEF